MNVTLTPILEEFVRRKVLTGGFSSADEVVCEGLRLLQQQDEGWASEARQKIDEGWSQAKAGALRSPDQVRENLATKKQAWKNERGPA